MAQNILIPRPDNFTPPDRTPWGGLEIPKLKAQLEIVTRGIVGESWEISGHQSFPNLVPLQHGGRLHEVPLWLIGQQAPLALYGQANVTKYGDRTPFLTKLLNSGSWAKHKEQLLPLLQELDSQHEGSAWQQKLGVASLAEIIKLNNDELHRALMVLSNSSEDIKSLHQSMIARNLSVQIHPDASYAAQNPSWHSKTEMWVILKAEPGAGLYLGLKEGVTKEQVSAALKENRDASTFLNFVEVSPGDIFFIPAGTPHAIGAGVLLLEQQETSETTFRYFSWWDGRQLHIEDAVNSTHWKNAGGMNYVNRSLRRQPMLINDGTGGMARHELLAAEQEFSYDRVIFSGGDVHNGDASQGMHGLTITEGQIFVLERDGTKHGPFLTGQSLIIPAALGAYELMAPEGIAATVYIGRSDPRK